MAEIKVITIQAGEEFLAALTKLLGGEAAAQVQAAVQAAGVDVGGQTETVEPEVTPEPEFDFGESVNGLEDDEDSFRKTYKVEDAVDMNVKVTPQGVVVSAESGDGEMLDDVIAPYGAYDEVIAEFDADEQELTVILYKVDEDGTDVEIEGW